MTVKVTVLYPNEPDATFDMDYYLTKHMPLVSEHWQKHGLKGWEVTKFQAGPDKTEPKYSVQATLIWDSTEDLSKAMEAPESKAIFDDIPNFSNKSPVFLGGKVLKSHHH